MSRGTYSGGTSSGAPGALIAACTPSRRGSVSCARTAPAGGVVSTSRPDLRIDRGAGVLMASRASLSAIMAANCCGVRPQVDRDHVRQQPGQGVSSNRAGSTYSRRSRTALFQRSTALDRVQSRAAYSADTNTTAAAACSP